MKNEDKLIGKCPICGKGNILKHSGNYICTKHFTNASGNPRCSFSLPFNYRGANLTDDIIRELIEKGETDYIEMVSRSDNPYLAKLVAIPHKGVEVKPRKQHLGIRCPKCGGRMLVTRQGYACENQLKKEATCNVFISNKIANRFIYKYEVIEMLEGKQNIIDGFKNNAKVSFSGYLHLNEHGSVEVVSKVGKCPNCGGDILAGLRAFNCSCYNKGCDFNVFREYSGHALTGKEIAELLETGKVEIESIDTYGNIFYYRLSIGVKGDKKEIKKEKFLKPIHNTKI